MSAMSFTEGTQTKGAKPVATRRSLSAARPAARPEIVAMSGYHSPQVNVEVRLNTNESPFPPPAAWQEALADHIAALDFARYPDRGAWSLREGIAALHGVSADQVFVANGSNEVLQTLCLTYGGAGRTIVTFEPTYAMHGQIARTTGAKVVEGARGEDFRIDPSHAAEVVEKSAPSITFLCSPNNPTGVVDDRSILAAVLAATTGIVVVDEAYGQFSDWSALSLVCDDLPLCVVRTFSKTWSMAAARLGYLIAPAWMVVDLEKVVLPYHLDSMKQAAGEFALRYEPEMRARVAKLVEERGSIMVGLGDLDVDVWPSQANFVLFRPRNADADAVWQGLVDRSVLVRNCASWPGLAGCLRVTVGTPAENARFLAELRSTLETLAAMTAPEDLAGTVST